MVQCRTDPFLLLMDRCSRNAGRLGGGSQAYPHPVWRFRHPHRTHAASALAVGRRVQTSRPQWSFPVNNDHISKLNSTEFNSTEQVNMLDTIVEYCPPTRVPSDDADLHRVLLVASFDGVRCSSAMDCRVRYALDWLAPSPVSSGGACVAPPTAAPSPMPSPYQPPTSSTDDGTPSPTWAFDGGEVADGGQNYLLRSVVRCAEAWANCSTLEAETTYGDGGEPEGGCTKLETVVGEVRIGGGVRGVAKVVLCCVLLCNIYFFNVDLYFASVV